MKRMSLVLGFVAGATISFMLPGCNTVRGVGRDVYEISTSMYYGTQQMFKEDEQHHTFARQAGDRK
jgi:predicted small secreted protein